MGWVDDVAHHRRAQEAKFRELACGNVKLSADERSRLDKVTSRF
jgi:hypothetical protein